jgi:subtilisin family serine protease
MKSFRLFLALSFAALACRPAAPTVIPAPAPAASPAPTPTAPAPAVSSPMAPRVPASTLDEPPKDWHLLDESQDHLAGTSANRAMRELLANRQPQRTVVVAIIDSGIDTAHVDLKANLWSNPKETPGNGRDDDNNGYVDDVRGWNFIGGRTGEDVNHDTYEVTRQFVRCTKAPTTLTEAERSRCGAIAADLEKQRGEAAKNMENIRNIKAAMDRALPLLTRAAGAPLTKEKVAAIRPTNQETAQAQQIYLALAQDGITPKDIEEGFKQVDSQIKYGLNADFDPRSIVGDNYADLTERRYGNADAMGPFANHGTHVAGIIGAVRGNGIGMDGIDPAVRIMSVRTVPDGDERDKDVANAIRYAADNGANIINMSFGKGYSPYKGAVDEAVKYADAKGVLMIHAAGNEGADLGNGKNFPTPNYLGGGRPTNWIEVGASSWKGGENLAATFSNYGHDFVDLFAPGVDIYSSIPGNQYEKDSGTSMAAPVVTGVAALLMSYFPSLTAADVKRILVASATRHGDMMVTRPGGDTKVPFGTLSGTGGIVNAYNAVKMAEQGGVRP